MYPTMLANASEMENKGLEILIRATPIPVSYTHLFLLHTQQGSIAETNSILADMNYDAHE